MTTTQPGPSQTPRPAASVTPPVATPAAPSATSTLREALLPVPGHVLASECMDSALKHLETAGVEYLAIADPEEGPLGVVSCFDIKQLKRKYPDHWADMRCGNVIVASDRFLNADDSFDAAISLLMEEGLRPLLVLERNTVCGVLEPTSVLQWCAEHRPAALQELALQDLS